ncbi:uncharacterized protein LOC102810221 [Saccoglossus kowalevskii]
MGRSSKNVKNLAAEKCLTPLKRHLNESDLDSYYSQPAEWFEDNTINSNNKGSAQKIVLSDCHGDTDSSDNDDDDMKILDTDTASWNTITDTTFNQKIYSVDNICNGHGTVLLNTEAIVNEVVRDIFQSTEYTQDGKLTLQGFHKYVHKSSKIPTSLFKYAAYKPPKQSEDQSQPTVVVEEAWESSPSNEDSDFTDSSVGKVTIIVNKAAEKLGSTSSPTSQTHIWTNVFPENIKTPYTRSKHAACVHEGNVYLYGGRDVNTTLKDLWKYDFIVNTWTLLRCPGDVPPALQEHTMVSYKDCIYIFGGEFGFCSSDETPLWIFNTTEKHWRKHTVECEVEIPSSRRGHTAVLYNSAMHVYGGYIDLKGSTNELWTFDCESKSWHVSYDMEESPPPRHCHSAVVHDRCMWVYGGLTNLTTRGDLWKWNFDTRKWSRIRYRQGPGELHGHSAVMVTNGMLIFGGEDGDRNMKNELWKFDFDCQTWHKISCYNQILPPPKSRHITVAIPTLSSQSPHSDRARSVPNLRRHKPSMDAIIEEAEDKLKRPYSSPPSFQSQETHYFKAKVYPLSPDKEPDVEPLGYQNKSFIEEQKNYNVQILKVECEDNVTESTTPCIIDEIIDLEDQSAGEVITHVQLSDDRRHQKLYENNKQSDTTKECEKLLCTNYDCEVQEITRHHDNPNDTTHQLRNQLVFKKPLTHPVSVPIPGVIRAEQKASSKVMASITQIDESKVDVSDKEPLLNLDGECSGEFSKKTLQANTWVQGFTNDPSSQSESLSRHPGIQSDLTTQSLLKCSHNSGVTLEERPKLHGRSRTLPLPTDLVHITSNKLPNTDHFIVSGRCKEETNRTEKYQNSSNDVTRFFVFGGKEQDSNVLQYTMPLSVWRCDIMTGQPTAQQIHRLLAETN